VGAVGDAQQSMTEHGHLNIYTCKNKKHLTKSQSRAIELSNLVLLEFLDTLIGLEEDVSDALGDRSTLVKFGSWPVNSEMVKACGGIWSLCQGVQKPSHVLVMVTKGVSSQTNAKPIT